MSFISSLVAKSSDCVLAEYTDCTGNHQQISRYILQKVDKNSTGIIKSGIKKFHYTNEEGITYLCLTEDISNDVCFAFLDDMKKIVLSKSSIQDIKALNGYGLKHLESEMYDLMDYYSIQPQTTKTGSLVDDFKEVENSSVQDTLQKFIDKEITLTINNKKDESNLNFEQNINNFVSVF